jgi:hypothetical protein
MAAGDRADRGDVGVLFVDLLFALVVVELLEPLRRPQEIAAEGWAQLGLTLALTMLSWIGYHLSVGRIDEPVRIDSPTFVHLVLDVAMVAAYWLCAVSFERVGAVYSWAKVPNPSAVPEALFIAIAFVLYVAWDWTARWIHGPWARLVNARRAAGPERPQPSRAPCGRRRTYVGGSAARGQRMSALRPHCSCSFWRWSYRNTGRKASRSASGCLAWISPSSLL